MKFQNIIIIIAFSFIMGFVLAYTLFNKECECISTGSKKVVTKIQKSKRPILGNGGEY